MTILIFGGTGFLGPHLIRVAIARGHAVTFFTRGKRAVTVDPGVEQLVGDRNENLDRLKGRTWDAVIDTCGYFPSVVRMSAGALREAVKTYLFVSSISVYADFSRPGLVETSAVGRLANAEEAEKSGQITGETYGPLKALCEEAVEAELPGRALVVRPGLIVGPGDPTDRFSYWPARLERGGEILAPAPEDSPVQVIDVRDLAEWMIAMLERDATGIYNATGPTDQLTMGTMLRAGQSISGSESTITWVSPGFLLEQGVRPFMELPLWIPGEDHRGFSDVSIAKAITHQLKSRPITETIRDTQTWLRTRPSDHLWQAGLSADRERELLAAWHEKMGAG